MKTHCKRKHDLAVVGVSKRGDCMECARERDRKRYRDNPGKFVERARKWTEANPDRVRENKLA